MKTKFIYALIALTLFACKQQNPESDTEVVETQVTASSFTAVPMPPSLASGQSFPTDSTAINNWVANSVITDNLETNPDIITHGWDLWDALTSYTDQSNNGQKLRRFETWYTPGDIQAALKSKQANPAFRLEDLARANTGLMDVPHQNHHGMETNSADVVGFVKCDPSSANHIYNKELYYFEVLKSMIKKGEIANIPAFPASSVLIKPVFFPLTSADSLGDGNYRLPVWPGYHNQVPIDSVLANGFGPNSWNNDITISTTGATDAANNVFSIEDFIHFKLDEAQAAHVFNIIDGGKAKAGDTAVLLAMHVNTRENRRWTWQTFWWSQNPVAPQSPSSPTIAGLQPGSLDNAASHYAMALAYNMISPAQPYTGGSNAVSQTEPAKQSVYAYNPYLEAPFNAAVFDVAPTSTSNSGGNDTIRKYYGEGYQRVGAVNNGGTYTGGQLNRVGIQTNCMSCHSQARMYDVPSIKDAFNYYATDQYIDLNAPYFNNTIVLDFAWSIQGSLIYKDSTNTAKK